MVATIETTSEPGPRRAARGGVAAATYPQGGTGIPSGEMNCPGAAAHMRPAAATGFRAVDATSGFGLSPNALNINGANTYQFVGDGPVGRADASGHDMYGFGFGPYINSYSQLYAAARYQQIQQEERAINQQILHKACKCATDAAELTATLASLGVDIGEGVDTFGTSVVVTAPLIAVEVADANLEMGKLVRDGCAPSYQHLLAKARSLVQLAGMYFPPANSQPTPWRLPPPTGPIIEPFFLP